MKTTYYLRKSLFCLLLLASFASISKADYPLFWQRYTADTWGIEYNGRLYLFCSHDTYSPQRGYGYFMNDITCISTDDLKNWTDHGEVFHAKDSRWGAQLTWAPCVVYHNNQFYLYYGDGNCGGIGIATSNSPTGPYIDNRDKPVVDMNTPGVQPGSGQWGMWCFDPSVWIEDDGQAFLYFGGGDPGNSRIIKLKDNLTEVEGKAIHPNTPGFFEASFVHKYKNKYYYSYAGHHFSFPANIEYVMSEHPMGPFSQPGLILPNPPINDGFNNHHSIFPFKGEYYIAYHNREVAYVKGEADKRSREYMRSVCLDHLIHNEDGTIRTVSITRDGLPQLKYINPYKRNEAETMAKGWGINTEARKGDSGNRIVSSANEGDYIKVQGVDFTKEGLSKLKALISCGAPEGGNIEIRLESENGLLIGTLNVVPTGDWDSWKTITTDVAIPNTGIFDLYFVFKGNKEDFVHIDYWEFTH